VTLVKTQNLTGTTYVLYRLRIEGLSTSSYSQIQIYDSKNKWIESRSLRGLDLNMSSPKVAVVSCANYRKLDNQEVMYSRVQDQTPDLMLFIGDIVYSNSRTNSLFSIPEDPSTALERYLITWNTVNLYQLEPLIPTLATWDDHDYGANNGDHTHPHKVEMKSIFRSFYPLPEVHQRLSFGPGVAFRLTAFGIDFHMMDGRTDHVKGHTQWGAQQEAWLTREFNSSSNPAWILNGVQYFRYFIIIESVQKSAEPSLAMLKNLLRSRNKPTLLVSGDVHSSQVQELGSEIFGFKTYEITSSGIHCNVAGQMLKRKEAEGQLFYYGNDNFLILRPSIQPSIMELDIACANADGTEAIFSSPLRIACA
jgi:phosphodiesterase/alkaline phosphatase D-like protein